MYQVRQVDLMISKTTPYFVISYFYGLKILNHLGPQGWFMGQKKSVSKYLLPLSPKELRFLKKKKNQIEQKSTVFWDPKEADGTSIHAPGFQGLQRSPQPL